MAEDVEERIEEIVEFLSQLEDIDQEFSGHQVVKKEYQVVNNFIRRLLARGNQLYFKADSYPVPVLLSCGERLFMLHNNNNNNNNNNKLWNRKNS